MSILGKIIGWLLGIGAVVVGGLYIIGACGPNNPPPDDDPWLTPDEAYEDQMAHTGMDNGAFVMPGLKIRDPREVSATEGHTPWHYALSNGAMETLQSGEIVYRRFDDGMLRRSVWVQNDGKVWFIDESGCLARDIYAFDGYYAGPDGSWVENVPRLTEDTRPVTGCKYREEGNPTGVYVQFAVLESGQYKVTRTYPTLGFSETYLLDPFGRGAYALAKEGDPETRAHLVVLPDNRTVQMSQAGETQRFIKE